MKLPPKQQRFAKLAALRKISDHIGLTSSNKSLRPSQSELAKRFEKYGFEIAEAALLVIADKNSDPLQRSACSILLEAFIPDWRELADVRLVGMVVERHDKEVRKWREAVLARDDHTCQECGAKENLHAHHIVRWADCPMSRIVVDNGMTLCGTCHTKAHA